MMYLVRVSENLTIAVKLQMHQVVLASRVYAKVLNAASQRGMAVFSQVF